MNHAYQYPYFEEWQDGEYLSGNACFDFEKMKRTEGGRHLMAARSLMSRFKDVDDKELLKIWEDMGVRSASSRSRLMERLRKNTRS